MAGEQDGDETDRYRELCEKLGELEDDPHATKEERDEILKEIADIQMNECNIVEFCGDAAAPRILMALRHQLNDVRVGHIAKTAGISRNAVYDNLDKLIKMGLIEKTRTENDTSYYRLVRNEKTRSFFEFSDRLDGVTFFYEHDIDVLPPREDS